MIYGVESAFSKSHKKEGGRAHMKEWNDMTIWTPRPLGLPIMEIYGVD